MTVSQERIERAAKAMVNALNQAEPTSAEWWGLENEERDLALELSRAALEADAPEATAAARDVLAERERQRSAEGWTLEHDDAHVNGQMALAAACYAANSTLRPDQNELDRYREAELRRRFWPWDASWWKPKDPRRDLVRAGALILAEIERLDRAASR